MHLDLGANRLEDSGIKLLCHVLQRPTCTLEELEQVFWDSLVVDFELGTVLEGKGEMKGRTE